MKIVLIIIGIIIVVCIALFLWSISRIYTEVKEDLDTGNDHEFPPVYFGIYPFDNFYIFKRFAYFLAEKDEEIRNYLLARKNRHDSHAADIHGSDVDGKTDSEDIPSDI